MQKHNFRHQALEATRRAREHLSDTTDLTKLRYAALEARLAMEAITYDRAQAYRDELPSSETGTWQPRRLLMVLLEIDDKADAGGTLSVGKQAAKGIPAPREAMRTLGTEVALNLKVLREHYDALGAYLHIPTIKQLEEGGGHDASRLHRRLSKIVAHLEAVIASTIYNLISPAPFSWIVCDQCGAKTRKRTPEGMKRAKTNCLGCGAPYTLTLQSDGTYRWWSDLVKITCVCGGEIVEPADKVKRDAMFDCPKCGETVRIIQRVRLATAAERARRGQT